MKEVDGTCLVEAAVDAMCHVPCVLGCRVKVF